MGASRSHCRWLFVPFLFAIGQWYLYISPAVVIGWTPTLWTGATAKHPNNTTLDYVPELQTITQGFDLGFQVARFIDLGCDKQDVSECALILNEASKVLQIGSVQRPLTKAELYSARQMAMEADNAQMGWTVWKWTRLLWLLGIMGILCFTIPCIFACLSLFKNCLGFIGTWVVAAWSFIVENVLTPLHQHGFLEAIAYGITFLICVESYRYSPTESGTSQYIA